MAPSRIAVIGSGAMGSALIRGALRAGVYSPQEIVAHDIDEQRLVALSEECGITTTPSLDDAVMGAETVLLAVKPQVISEVFEDLTPVIRTDQLVISIAAGVPTSRIEEALGNIPVIRVMPNTPCLVGASASALAPGRHATPEHMRVAMELFGAVGVAVEVPEDQLDAVTGLSGSGPAYVYLIIEALSDAGVRCGLPRDVSTSLAAETVLGAAKMVLETKEHPGRLKDQVASPGGTTIAGLHQLELHGVRGAIYDAVCAAVERARELSQQG